MRGTTLAIAGACAVAVLFAAAALIAFPRSVAPWPQLTLVLVLGGYCLVLGSLIARRDPGNAASVLLAAAGVCLVVTNAPAALGVFEAGWMLLYLPLALLLLVVPDGRPASRGWRAIGAAICVVVVLFVAAVAIGILDPVAAEPLLPPSYILLFAFFALLVACAVAPIARYRRASERVRMQLRWVFVAGLSLPLTLLLCWASYLLLGTPDLVAIGLILMFTAIPAGVTIAIVHPGLFDINRAAVATVTATVLAAVVLAVLSVASAAVGIALVDWSRVAAIAWTAALTLAAVLVSPVIHRQFDRMLYPERGRTVAALRQLQSRVDAGADDASRVQEVLRASLRDPDLLVGYRGLSDGALRTETGALLTPGTLSTPLRVRGEEIGAIVPGRERVTRVAAAVAVAAAPLADAARVQAELARATAEVEASRQRILRAGYEERRRLERDLHDGAQQRLVALGMRLRVLQRTSGPDDAVSASLDSAVAELATAVAELRQIAHGVRPSSLDDGLAAALTDLTRRSPSPIELDVRTPELPDDVATTAYYVVNEAVTNALRYADATRIRVTVCEEIAHLQIRIDDDGCGGAAVRPGGGLRRLTDRVETLGGWLTIASSAAGTTVEASIPCAW